MRDMHGLGMGTFPLEQILQTLRAPGHLSLAWHSPSVTPWATPLPSAVGWGQAWVHLSTPKSLAWKAGGPCTLGPPNLCQLSATPPEVVAKPPRPCPQTLAVTLPVLLVELQHHVVGGHAEGPPGLVVLPALAVVHVRRGHGAVVGVVVHVQGAAVVPRHVELDVWGRDEG